MGARTTAWASACSAVSTRARAVSMPAWSEASRAAVTVCRGRTDAPDVPDPPVVVPRLATGSADVSGLVVQTADDVVVEPVPSETEPVA